MIRWAHGASSATDAGRQVRIFSRLGVWRRNERVGAGRADFVDAIGPTTGGSWQVSSAGRSQALASASLRGGRFRSWPLDLSAAPTGGLLGDLSPPLVGRQGSSASLRTSLREASPLTPSSLRRWGPRRPPFGTAERIPNVPRLHRPPPASGFTGQGFSNRLRPSRPFRRPCRPGHSVLRCGEPLASRALLRTRAHDL